MSKPNLICVVGPTAVGKTAVAIQLSKKLNADIVSADSRQFYKELEIGTAKPSIEELNEAPHHFINTHSIHDSYSVGQFEKEALAKLGQLFSISENVILVGGSGLFVDAVCDGLDEFPEVDEAVRGTLRATLAENGLASLQEELKQKDPAYYETVDLNNPQRIVRALEVINSTGKPFSMFRKRVKKERPFSIVKVGLEMDRARIYERIDLRMDQMISAGLFEEAKTFEQWKDLNALQTVGYKEIFGYLSGAYDKEEAIRLLKRNSRRYAKRQLTWFKRDQTTEWFDPRDLEGILTYLRASSKTV